MKTGRPTTTTSTPLRLRALLRRLDIPAERLSARIKQTRGRAIGRPLGHGAMSRLLCHNQWPPCTTAEEIKARTEELLRERGATEADIETAWEADGVVPPTPKAAPDNHDETLSAGKHEQGDVDFQLPEAEMLSPAAREHFSLARHPFIDDVQGPQDVYLSKEQRYCRDAMYYAAKHSGFVAVIGESGSGKSTLRRDLVDRIHAQGEPIVIIQPACVEKRQLSAAHICDAIVADLSHETAKLSLEAKARQIQRILRDSARGGNAHVLVIEEAHDLSISTLKYLKRFWELEDGFKKLIGIILIGQPELGERLDERRNYEAREVIRRCEVARLRPLNGNLEEYLTLKFKRVGKTLDELFERDAFDAIRERLTRRRPGTNEAESHLYPLVVQNVVVRCMNEAVNLGLERVTAELVRRI